MKKDYREMRAALINIGLTPRAWAKSQKPPVPLGTLYNSLRGLRNGPRAVAIRRQVGVFISNSHGR